MTNSIRVRARFGRLCALAGCLLIAPVTVPPAAAQAGQTRLAGLRTGPHAVGFEVRAAVDRTRHVDTTGAGTPVGVAAWYPAAGRPDASRTVTALDYRLLQFATPLAAPERQLFAAEEASALAAWRHIGVVEMTAAQALASLRTGGVAVRGAPPLPGRRPVVVVLGGRSYLSTTAEFLASHGFLVVAAFRFSDRSNEVGTSGFSWYLENSVRDAEFALSPLQDDPRADTGAVSAIGHGGGGIQAVLFAMRNRRVRSLVAIDAGIFSGRSGTRGLPFYSPRLLRVPFLYVATPSTRAGQDQFEDFEKMAFSERYQVILKDADVRHHDLSDLGRAVTAPLQIRGAPQEAVQRAYADIHDMALRFLQEQVAAVAPREPFAAWLTTASAEGRYAVTASPRVQPAPTVVEVEQTLGPNTPGLLREARARDPEAPLFEADAVLRIARKALAAGDFATAIAVAEFGATIHPSQPQFLELQGAGLESSGALERARALTATCAAAAPGNDWRAALAVGRCAERVKRLASRPD